MFCGVGQFSCKCCGTIFSYDSPGSVQFRSTIVLCCYSSVPDHLEQILCSVYTYTCGCVH